MTQIDLPGVDAITARWAVSEVTRREVDLSPAVGQFLQFARAEGVVPLLVTGVDARISLLLNMELARMGGIWLVRKPDGQLVDGVVGVPVADFEAALDRAAVLERSDVTVPAPQPGESFGALGFELLVHHRATDELRVGKLAEDVVRLSLDDGPDCWGSTNPLSHPWDRNAITREARRFMPMSSLIRGSSPRGAQFVLHYERTRHGVTERLRGALPLGPYADVLDRSLEVSDAIGELMARSYVPVAGMTTLIDVEEDLSYVARGRRPEVPRMLLAGPWALKDAQADLEELVALPGARRVGRAAIPSVLFRFDGGVGALPPWLELQRVFLTAGLENVARTVGLVDR